MLHRPELEPCDMGTTVPGWSCPTRTPAGRAGAVRRAHQRAELDAATMAAVLACATGAELELSSARAHQRAELDAATMAATLARTSGAELELSGVGATGDARAPAGPSWNCPT